MTDRSQTAHDATDYSRRVVLVGGSGVAGAASARALLSRGADVTVLDRAASPALDELARAGARTVVAGAPPAGLLDGVTDVVVSPGFPPTHPLAVAAARAGIEVYSEPELAWRLRGPDAPPWLAVTGTNGKTTTVTMLAAILRAAGLRAQALGNIGRPLVDAAVDPGYDVLAVELSSFQLHWSRRLAPRAAAILNLADDHLDWHGGFDAYAAAKTAIWRSATPAAEGVAVGNLDDPRVAGLLRTVTGDVVGVTAGDPAPGQFGVIDGVLVEHGRCAAPTALIEAMAVRPAGAHNVSNALHAAALARALGVPFGAVGDGLRGYVPEPHRNAPVADVAGVRYVDDSKATNPHAALASLTGCSRLVWVAGGQLKGVDVAPLVAEVAHRLVGAVLLGVDRGLIAEALRRHAPDLPVIEVASTDDGAMGEAVRAAARLAAPGDTVVLAPAAASKDMFVDYAARGEAFADAVRALATGAARAGAAGAGDPAASG
ncbi:UDP-N-acetylmuramoyl-L-alanine--D-glutamate ligase [Pilimelia columellifera]|uniref:UDP-N-acetylmuramoylalanine--D-glutamate ligase n=1 Tax=Pilimelia columellifera subsp. columellifera TaxID=706583 RepID=A0ABN3N9N2_9ACTN